MKIVLIGAGSRSFGLSQIIDVLICKELCGRGVTLALVDENAPALERMLQIARRIKAHAGSDITIEAATDRTAMLPGADYVVVAVSRQRFKLWEQDFRVPLAFGFQHVLGENGGPGALFHALRSFEIVIPICRDMERLCPGAMLLNFTNPEARVLHAICHLTSVKATGFCHGIFTALNKIAEYAGKPLEALDITSAGMNHFYCILQAKDKATGANILPMLLQKAAHDSSPGISPLFKKFAAIFDVFTFPSEDHIGEYVAFGSEFHGARWKYGQECRAVLREEKPAPDILKLYAEEKLPPLRPSGELTVPVICDMALNRGALRPAINVLNTAGYIENLPRDIVVEVPGTVDAQGVHPLHVGSLPESFAAFMRPHFAIHGILTEAYRTRSRKLLLQALLLDPNVNSITRAEQMLDVMLELQRDFLPEFN